MNTHIHPSIHTHRYINTCIHTYISYLTSRGTLINCAFEKIPDRSFAVQRSEVDHLKKEQNHTNFNIYSELKTYGIRITAYEEPPSSNM